MRLPSLAAALATTALIAGCSHSTSGAPDTPSPATTPTTERDYGAPEFNQIPLTRFPQSPCAVITTDQWKRNGLVGKEEHHTNSAGSSCKRATEDKYSRYASIRILDSPSGLRGLFSRQENYPVFHETMIAEYHAVLFQNAKHDSMCRTTVLVNPETLLAASASVHKQREKYDPCELSKKFAEYAVENLKEQG